MSTMKAKARRAGALYLLFSILAVVGEYTFPAFMVPGDAAATARNIATAEFSYRLSILTGFATLVLFLVVVSSLYELLKDVHKGQAVLMVVLVSVGVAVALANLLRRFAPLVLLAGADASAAFTRAQLEALAQSSIEMQRGAGSVVMAFWGLWLFPFGALVIESRFLPRILGILLLVAGFAYLANSVVSMVLPAARPIVSKIVTPLYFGEVPIIFWLLIKGAGEPRPQIGTFPPDGRK